LSLKTNEAYPRMRDDTASPHPRFSRISSAADLWDQCRAKRQRRQT
jgi:hypothetical protein